MFDNRELRVRLAKTPKNNDKENNEVANVIGESAANVVYDTLQDLGTSLLIGVLAVVVVIKVVDAVCQIAVKKTPEA